MPRGGFGRGFGRGFGMRRFGAPLIVPMGGYGWGTGGFGSPLLTSLLAGGVGYALGSNTAQQGQQPPPPYPYPYPSPPMYQAPSAPAQGQPADTDRGKLAQLQLLGELREAGTLTEEEFEREKQRILNS
jgi:hypothetical protein